MKRWARARYQPNLPLSGTEKITASREHIALSKEAAVSGMVLLKNEGELLPLPKGSRVALFGKGSFDYVKGGGGSGDVGCPYVRNLHEGLVASGTVRVFEPLSDFYRSYVEEAYRRKGAAPGMIPEAQLPEELLRGAVAYTDTAIYTVSRFSGEGWDRSDIVCNTEYNPWENETSMPEIAAKIYPKGDFYLTEEEERTIEAVKEHFAKVIVVLNVGGIIDMRWLKEDDRVSSVLLAWQGGMEGGLAAAELLTGAKTPSGKLPDTVAGELADYPSTANYHESFDYVEYTEDIFVGYRYFETIPGAAEKVVYPFGYGLSYTEFEALPIETAPGTESISVAVRVTNRGKHSGRETVFLYYSAPNGRLDRPKRELLAFAKTRKLLPGESQILTLSAPTARMAAYDEGGVIAKSAFVLEQGVYRFYLGGDVQHAEELSGVLELTEDQITEQCAPYLAPTSLSRRLHSDGSYEALEVTEPLDKDECIFEKMVPGTEEGLVPGERARGMSYVFCNAPEGKFSFEDVADGKHSLDEFLNQLSDEELIHLLGGQPNVGVSNTFGFGNLPEYGIPTFLTADGPAGIRLAEETGIQTTAWPCATLLAATFDTELLERVGAAGGKELKENNLQIWLTPGMNIHRNPMCGRNFEYFSEDPLVAGKMAAAIVRGIQSNGVAACPKHFAANNKETNRKHSDSRVSERALREIYLKGFRIMIEESHPMVIMSSYNVINGQRASESRDLLTGILREEWGYEGMVTSDWWNRAEHYKEILAGNDVKMGTGFVERVKKAMEWNALTREDLLPCAKRVLELFLKLD